jgi:hypothetical protein
MTRVAFFFEKLLKKKRHSPCNMKVLEVSVASERKKDPSFLDHAGQAEVMTVTKKQNQGFFLHKRKVRNKKKG